MASSSVSGGRMVGSRRAAWSFFPAPGGPSMITLWAPAAATRARLRVRLPAHPRRSLRRPPPAPPRRAPRARTEGAGARRGGTRPPREGCPPPPRPRPRPRPPRRHCPREHSHGIPASRQRRATGRAPAHRPTLPSQPELTHHGAALQLRGLDDAGGGEKPHAIGRSKAAPSS